MCDYNCGYTYKRVAVHKDKSLRASFLAVSLVLSTWIDWENITPSTNDPLNYTVSSVSFTGSWQTYMLVKGVMVSVT